MLPGEITDKMLQRMRPEDRKALGLHTTEEAQAKLGVKQERKLQSDCETYLRLHKIQFLHLSHRSREKVGWPDLVFPHPVTGTFCAVELKTETGKVSPEQAAMLQELRACGAKIVVIRSFADFIAFINILEK